MEDEKEEIFECQRCDNMFFSSKETLQQHLFTDHIKKNVKVKNWPCLSCDVTFSNLLAVQRHIMKIHVEQRLPCDQCDMTFKSEVFLAKHKLVNHGDESKKMKIPESESTEKQEAVTNKTTYYCNYEKCTKFLLKAREDLLEHMKQIHRLTSSMEAPFECLNCNKNDFSSLGIFQDHVIKMHVEKFIHCNQCNFTASNEFYLAEHKLMKHSDDSGVKKINRVESTENQEAVVNDTTYYCNYEKCEKFLLKDREDLLEHVKQIHKLTRSIETPFQCLNCTKNSFSSFKTLWYHVIETHMEKCIRCDKCDFTAKGNYDLIRHQQWEHGMTSRYDCSNCQYVARDNNRLNNHISAVHKKEKPFKCDKCKFSTAYSHHLKKHTKYNCGPINGTRILDKEKRFYCSVCPYETYHPFNIKRHINELHANNRDFECTGCEKTFARKIHLEKHFNSHHAETSPFMCEFCGKRYGSKYGLEDHVNRIHVGVGRYKCHMCEFNAHRKNKLTEHLKEAHKFVHENVVQGVELLLNN